MDEKDEIKWSQGSNDREILLPIVEKCSLRRHFDYPIFTQPDIFGGPNLGTSFFINNDSIFSAKSFWV